MIYSIYKISNIVNNKVYIGFTHDPDGRWRGHRRINSRKNDNKVLSKAMRKYGVDKFHMEVIYQSKDLRHTIDVMEPYFIKEYNSFGKTGYNMTLGGEGTFGKRHSEETKKKISENSKKLVHTQKFKDDLSSRLKCNHPYRGKNRSQETIDKIKKTKRDRPSFSGRNYYVILDNNRNISMTNNLSEYCKTNNISHGNLSENKKSKGFRLLYSSSI